MQTIKGNKNENLITSLLKNNLFIIPIGIINYNSQYKKLI